MKLLHDNLLVQPIEEEAKTKSGIILGASARKENFAMVRYVGPKVKACKVGMKIKYYENSGTPINIKDNDYLLMKEAMDVIAIME